MRVPEVVITLAGYFPDFSALFLLLSGTDVLENQQLLVSRATLCCISADRVAHASATSQTGAAGEFYVAAQLSQRGWAASLLLDNAPHTDILARHAETGSTVAVQVKAANGSGDFQARAKAELAVCS